MRRFYTIFGNEAQEACPKLKDLLNKRKAMNNTRNGYIYRKSHIMLEVILPPLGLLLSFCCTSLSIMSWLLQSWEDFCYGRSWRIEGFKKMKRRNEFLFSGRSSHLLYDVNPAAIITRHSSGEHCKGKNKVFRPASCRPPTGNCVWVSPRLASALVQYVFSTFLTVINTWIASPVRVQRSQK